MSHDKEHKYSIQVKWTGNLGKGTGGYRAYSRDHEISGFGKAAIPASSDPAFRGNPGRYNPEEPLVGSLSACHMLWYLHLCAEAGVTVLNYLDQASGIMLKEPDGAGRFKEVVLSPQVAIRAGGDLELAVRLHERAHRLYFITNFANFPVRCRPKVQISKDQGSCSLPALIAPGLEQAGKIRRKSCKSYLSCRRP